MKTAVEFAVEEIIKLTGLNIAMDEPCIVKALEMESEQIISAFTQGDIFGADYFDGVNPTGENYYNETFKQQEQ